jgi:tetratricopeptide (TPR) repeat protein
MRNSTLKTPFSYFVAAILIFAFFSYFAYSKYISLGMGTFSKLNESQNSEIQLDNTSENKGHHKKNAKRALMKNSSKKEDIISVPQNLEMSALIPDNNPEDSFIRNDALELREKANQLANSGKVVEAISEMNKAVKLDPGQSILKRELSHLLAMAGWGHYVDNEYSKASGFFEESLFHWPENLDAIRGHAAVLYKLKNKKPAEDWLLYYIELGGDRPDVYTLLGRINYENDKMDEAVKYYQLSLVQDPEQPKIQSTLDRIKREIKVENNFAQSKSSNFIFKYEGDKQFPVARVIETICEEAFVEVGMELGYYPDEPVTVILYTDSQFADVTRSPAWARAIFDGKIRLPVKGLSARTDVLERIIFHEYTHAVVHEISGGRAPVWLHEGLAQRSEDSDRDQVPMAFSLIESGGPRPFTELESSFLTLKGTDARLAYAQSYLAVHCLEDLHGPYSIRELLRYLRITGNVQDAFKKTTNREYQTFDDEFAEWIENIIY